MSFGQSYSANPTSNVKNAADNPYQNGSEIDGPDEDEMLMNLGMSQLESEASLIDLIGEEPVNNSTDDAMDIEHSEQENALPEYAKYRYELDMQMDPVRSAEPVRNNILFDPFGNVIDSQGNTVEPEILLIKSPRN